MSNLQPGDPELIRNLFKRHEFIDRAVVENEMSLIDVIVPVLHSTDLWEENLTSFYREIPINRLIIGDAGCIDRTIEIVQQFPRVEVIDQRHLKTLGTSIAELIQKVETEKFVYLQSDVYLPSGWYEVMLDESQRHDWVGTPMQIVVMLDYLLDYSGVRPLAGAQLGRSSLFKHLRNFIDDDFVYRQEDFVLDEFVRLMGGSVGETRETFHFHQVMRRVSSGMQMNVNRVSVDVTESLTEKDRVESSQLQGFIKYCNPKSAEVRNAAFSAYSAQNGNQISKLKFFLSFASRNNSHWRRFICLFAIHDASRKFIDSMRKILFALLNRALGN